jgi:hypothetical protein
VGFDKAKRGYAFDLAGDNVFTKLFVVIRDVFVLNWDGEKMGEVLRFFLSIVISAWFFSLKS